MLKHPELLKFLTLLLGTLGVLSILGLVIWQGATIERQNQLIRDTILSPNSGLRCPLGSAPERITVLTFTNPDGIEILACVER